MVDAAEVLQSAPGGGTTSRFSDKLFLDNHRLQHAGKEHTPNEIRPDRQEHSPAADLRRIAPPLCPDLISDMDTRVGGLGERNSCSRQTAEAFLGDFQHRTACSAIGTASLALFNQVFPNLWKRS